jgi:hypothetical protein
VIVNWIFYFFERGIINLKKTICHWERGRCQAGPARCFRPSISCGLKYAAVHHAAGYYSLI